MHLSLSVLYPYLSPPLSRSANGEYYTTREEWRSNVIILRILINSVSVDNNLEARFSNQIGIRIDVILGKRI